MPISARTAFPCFDEPSWKTPFDVWLTVSTGDVAVSNTQPTEQQDAGAFKRVHFAQTKPLPTYLVAFAVGPLDTLAGPKASTPLRVVATRGKAAQGALALETSAKLLSAMEGYFGTPYPVDKLDLANDAEANFLGHIENVYGVGNNANTGLRGTYDGTVGFLLD